MEITRIVLEEERRITLFEFKYLKIYTLIIFIETKIKEFKGASNIYLIYLISFFHI